jgi:hypothetical protein
MFAENEELQYGEETIPSIKNSYVRYCQKHIKDSTHWPIELCLHAVTKIYGFKIVVLAETLLEGGTPSGYIFERLATDPDSSEHITIFIGNRWNQHYYAIGNLFLSVYRNY